MRSYRESNLFFRSQVHLSSLTYGNNKFCYTCVPGSLFPHETIDLHRVMLLRDFS